MRSRDQFPRRGRRPVGPRGRERCGHPERDDVAGQQLLHPRELYVGTLSGPAPALWRVAIADDRRSELGPAPTGADDDVILRWAARQLLTAALRHEVSGAAVGALAAELPQLTGPDLELSDLEVRLWFLGWRLRHRAA